MMFKTVAEACVVGLVWLAGLVVYFMLFEDTSGIQAQEQSRRARQQFRAKTARAKQVGGDAEHAIMHDGRERHFFVHMPKGADGTQKLPVVLAFHGGGGRPESQRTTTRMDEVADRFGFIVVYPEGTGILPRRFLTWNAGFCCGYAKNNNVDDVGFVREMLNELPRLYPVNTRKVYATGISNGAIFSYRLALELSDRITAIAPVSGGMGIEAPPPPRPVPLLHFHGLKDPDALFLGGQGASLSREPVIHPPIPKVIAWWVRANHCGEKPVEVHKDRDFIRTTYAPPSGQPGAPVVLYELPEGGHTWPGGVDLTARLGTGKLIESVDASTIMWEFFRQFELPAPAGTAKP